MNDIKTIVAAENQGKTFAEIGASPLARQFREFAGSFLGIGFDQDEGGKSGEAGVKSGLSSLFTRKN